MPFRYADGTPFPLGSNFLATASRVIGVCADLVANDLVDIGWDDVPRAAVLSLLDRALPLTELPETRCAIRFETGRAAGSGALMLAERTYFGLELEAAVELDAHTVFHGPFRVREVADDVEATLPERRWFGRPSRRRSIGAHFVVGAAASDGVSALRLARRRGAPATFVDLDQRAFVAPDGARHPIHPDDVEPLTALWRRVARGMYNRADRVPRRLVAGALDGESLEHISDPSALVAKLVGAIAPLFAELLYRGGRSDALVLYEDETPHVLPLGELQRTVARLPASARDAFVPLGLAAPRPGSGVRPLPLAWPCAG